MPILFTKKSCNKGVEPPPQIPLTVKTFLLLQTICLAIERASSLLGGLFAVIRTFEPSFITTIRIPSFEKIHL